MKKKKKKKMQTNEISNLIEISLQLLAMNNFVTDIKKQIFQNLLPNNYTQSIKKTAYDNRERPSCREDIKYWLTKNPLKQANKAMW